MGMFCFQCQETAKGKGCTIMGVCGKNPEVANLQDLLIYSVKGVSEIMVKGNLDITKYNEIKKDVVNVIF